MALAIVALMIAAYHFWLFHLTRQKTERIWAGLISVGVALYALEHLGTYTRWSVLSAPHWVQLGFIGLSIIVHAVVAYSWSLRGLWRPKGLYIIMGLNLIWCALFLFTPYGITGPLTPIELGWLPEPYLRPTIHLGAKLFMVYGFGLTIHATISLVRNWRPGGWERFILPASFLFWIVAAFYDAAVALDFLAQPKAFITEYGLAGTAIVMLGRTVREHAKLASEAVDARDEAEASFERLLQQSPEPIFLHLDGVIAQANTAALQLLGISALAGLLNKESLSLFHEADREAVESLFREIEQGLLVTPYTTKRLNRRDGSYATIELSMARINYGRKVAVLMVAHDISDQQILRAKMMAMDRMIAIGTLAAGVAHEINNPLAYVYANLELVRESFEELQSAGNVDFSKDSMHKFVAENDPLLEEASDGVMRIKRIVDDLRSTAHGSSDVFDEASEADNEGGVDPRADFESETLQTTLGAALRLTRNKIKHRAALVEEIEELPPVLAPPGRLAQVFINLLSNAADAIPAGESEQHTITARCFKQGSFAVVEIEDDGEGISEEDLPKIFDAFYTTKSVGQGTGLGLAICRRIVNRCGGELEVQSSLGRGSRFRVSLPLDTLASA